MKAMIQGKSLSGAALVAALLAVSPVSEALAVRCGDVIGPNETVVLDEDVRDCAGPGAALTVIGPATLDLGAHAVGCADAPQPVDGIVLIGKRAKLRGGRVLPSCNVGVRLAGEGRHRVDDITVYFADVGVLVDSDANVIENVGLIHSESRGVLVRGKRNRVVRGFAETDGTGYEIADGVGNRLVKTAAVGNDDYGYLLSGGDRASLHGNVALANGRDGFRVARGSRHLLKDNFAEVNDEGGYVVVGQSERIRLQGNEADSNGGAGIQVWTPGHTLQRNTATSNDANQQASFDLEDRTVDCSTNRWRANVFVSANVGCIR